MAFKGPVISPLTETQERLLAQLGSLKNILSLPLKKQIHLAAEKQISSFDYILRIAESTIGKAFIDIMLKKFIDEIFDPNNYKLEKIILHAIAKTLDSRNQKISNDPNISNDQWLTSNALEPLHILFQVVKVLIVKQIIAMIFGPKNKMGHDTLNQIQIQNPPATNDILNNVIAAESMFSLSTSEGNDFGEMEYNTVELQKQLEKGIVQFVISCQEVKIKLPENFDQEIDNILNGVLSTLPGTTAYGSSGTIRNPSMAFNYIENHIGNEIQRINSQENVNAVRKSWLQILIDKIFNLLIISITPFLLELLNSINSENPTLNLTIVGLLSSPFELKNLQQSDPQQFDQKSVFMKNFLNAMYALLLSILLKALIKEIKKLIKNAIAKRAAIRLQSKLKRLQKIRQNLNMVKQNIEKAKRAAELLKNFDEIFNYSRIA